jgi:hypothetical protein
MHNDKTNMRDEESIHQGDRGTKTMQHSKTERGEISNHNHHIEDDDAMMDETTRGEIGAGE